MGFAATLGAERVKCCCDVSAPLPGQFQGFATVRNKLVALPGRVLWTSCLEQNPKGVGRARLSSRSCRGHPSPCLAFSCSVDVDFPADRVGDPHHRHTTEIPFGYGPPGRARCGPKARPDVALETMIAIKSPLPIGLLEIEVCEAKNLLALDVRPFGGSSSDPYVKARRRTPLAPARLEGTACGTSSAWQGQGTPDTQRWSVRVMEREPRSQCCAGVVSGVLPVAGACIVPV